jgi:large subunit ribosomal protein L4
MKLSVQGGGSVDVADQAFGARFNEALVHQVVTAYMAGGRAGTKAQKTRAEVSGGGRKPWKQKGSGRARAGTIRSPIWVGGGRAFAARPRDFAQKVNRKMYTAALRAVFSELVRQERLVVVDSIPVTQPKTRSLVQYLETLKIGNALIVVNEPDQNLALAARNLPGVEVLAVGQLNPVSLVRFDKVLVTAAALRTVAERLA